MAYMKDLADETLVEEVHNRLSRIDIDGIFESQFIEELIEDTPSTPFPLIYSTERPDACAANLLEGRVCIFVDGTPFVLVAPGTLLVLLQSSEDYYENWILSTTIRWLRYLYFYDVPFASFSICCCLKLPSGNVTNKADYEYSLHTRKCAVSFRC